MDAQQIYENFHPQAKGTGGLESAQQIAQELSHWFPDSAVSVQKLVDGIQAGWKGTAAEAASQGLTPLAENSLATGRQLGTAQDLISRQVGSFHTAVSEVQRVPAAPQMQNMIAAAATGQLPQPMLTQMAQHQAIQQANVDAYSKYVAASQYNTANLPPLSESVPTQSAPVAVAPPAALPSAPAQAAPGGGARAMHLSGGASGGVPMGAVVASGGAGRTAPSPIGGVGPSLPTSSGGGTGPTTISSAPASVTTSPAPVWTPPVGSGGASSPGSGQPAWLGEPIVPVGGLSAPPVEANPLPGVPRPAAGSGVPGAELPGLGGGRSSVLGGQVPGGGAAAGEEDGVGPRSGAAPGSVAAEEDALATERGAVSRGASSTAAGPMMGGRGGKGERDAEHKRKYVVDEDGEMRFGSTERVAPPVIGEM
ncbi:MAG TPA: hypothetical protein VEO01_31715 [Pseudonocardiaceae bacterium]|nr:hypothetical protein [Pseudonocardiaceae bacterium]